MSKTSYTFSVLQATAAVVSLAILAWSLGFPSLQFANAASVTSFSDTLSDSTPSVASDHTIAYTADAGVAATETIVLTFDAGFTGITSLAAADIDLNINGSDVSIQDGAPASGIWGVTYTATTITFTSNDTTVGAGQDVIIEIGEVAGGTNQITNPTAGSYELGLASGASDTGETRVAIVEAVTVSASVDTVFTFTVFGVAGGTSVGGDTTGGDTTPTAVPFGELEAGTASTAAQALQVSTNASNGFVVTAAVNQQLTSTNGDDIDGFIEGAFTTTPTAWASPVPVLGDEFTYGHWGMSSTDTTLTETPTDLYTGGTLFVSASTTPVEVFRHDGPINGAGAGTGSTTVIYKAETTSLQEAATDYTATLTYVATPVF